MTGETTVALEILERAVRIEQEERGFYLQASRLAPEETGRRMFEQLAGDEARHLEMVRRQQASLRRGNRWAAHPPAAPGPVNLDRPLFPRSRAVLEKAIATATRGAGTLLFGLDVESRSYDMYREAAATTADPQGRSVLESLAGEESLHFEILMMRYEFLYGAVA